VATSVLREAANQNEILHWLQLESLIDGWVISGREEARLIFLGVASATPVGDKKALFIDIGGGNTKLAVGSERDCTFLESFKFGAIRLSNIYLPRDHTGPVSPDLYRKIQRHIKNCIVQSLGEIRKHDPKLAIGSSGTIMNLAEIARKAFPHNGEVQTSTLSGIDLRKVIDLLCSLSLERRRKVPGINPERADIIIGRAAILDVFMKELSLDSITITSRGLQDGLLNDNLSRMDDFPLLDELSPRQRSALQLGRSSGINEVHARTVTSLVLELFDSARETGLHPRGDHERELLEYATILHDIGSFISYTNHHAHSYYLIRNSELLGFNQKEVTIMANIARFHRKKAPRKKDPEILELEPREREMMRSLATILCLIESLDRSHATLIQHVRFTSSNREDLHLEVSARGDCHLEMWGIEGEKKALEKAFGKKLAFTVTGAGNEPG